MDDASTFSRPAPRVAVLLVNLGTPEAPTAPAVRRYLAEFLADRRVIDLPRWLWWPILHGVILRIRPARSAAAYRRIWTPQGSPLRVISEMIAAKLGALLSSDGVEVHLAMRYGQPTISETITRLMNTGMRKLVVLPLYPQYSATSTGAVLDAVADAMKSLRWPPALRTINDYCDDDGYLAALAQCVEAHWAAHGRAEKLMLSFHGIPQRYVAAGDPYLDQCRATAQQLGKRLQLSSERLIVAFQSRVGREEWLKPYTDIALRELATDGVRSVQVLCPGFAADCLETLDEIAFENREIFLRAGGERYEYIPALNDGEAHITALTALVRRNVAGWAEITLDAVSTSTTPSPP